MRRDWTKDYEEISGPDGKTGYIYKGARYVLTEQGRRACLVRVTPLLTLALALLAAMGFLNSPGSRIAYVALPWAALCFLIAFALFDDARILLARRALTARDYKSSALRLKRTVAWAAAFSILLTGCDALYILLNGGSAGEYPFLVLSICVLFSCESARRT
jgi:hypothetical protein